MKNKIAAAINVLSLIFLFIGIALFSFNSPDGLSIKNVKASDFNESAEFETLVSESVNDIFSYTELKDLFESKGKLNLNQVIAQVNENGISVPYSLEYLIEYARSTGFYLNEKNQLMEDGPRTINKEDEEKRLVNVTYRAYMPNFVPTEPGSGIMSLAELSRETLTYLAKYYSVRSEFFDSPCNLHFYIYYTSGKSSEEYSNGDLDINNVASLGKYVYTNSSNLKVNTNMKNMPSNLLPLLQAKNPYHNGDYNFILSVDSDFPANDIFKKEAIRYEKQHNYICIGLILMGINSLILVISYLFLISFTGKDYEKDQKNSYIKLYKSDMIPVEIMIVLFLIYIYIVNVFTSHFMLSVIEVLGNIENLEFWHSALDFLLKYIVFIPISLSIVRNFKSDTLYRHSLLKKLLNIIKQSLYKTDSRNPKLFNCCLFVLPNLSALVLIVLLLRHFINARSLYSFITALCIFIVIICIDAYTWRIATGLKKAVDIKVRSERLKADLITNVSHDLKTPLTSIINYVDLMKREDIKNERIKLYLEVLEQKSGRLKTLTEDLVEASKASSGNVNIQFANLDFTQILIQALAEFEDKFLINKLEIISDIPENPVIISADGRRLWRVIENLLNNVCKYALRESRVYINIEDNGEYAKCTIKNISQAPLNISPQELTERFVRGDVSRTTEGSGLGLSIAKSLTGLMKGKLIIEIDGDLYKASIVFPSLKESNNEKN